ncbi:Malonyl CoA-acyl carrier protein transacylase [Halomicronema hongdechloris C2206]|uniref:Malonyl CoA-acyl carrier protein transacylase n=1 Tax=Halomicronema hongdechloris C2206 TaxID=1641165 RepID=A0A1Z3HR60_9CYAN|nr:ACP S-malonyltransferase [Halomicronema hongdechloris]ASC72804.1 Malonyl CoA-acyl carrier protein transacylase [Halomicronema hongdechloris C2206]
MTKTAWVFPGQGSQVIGMGADLAAVPLAMTHLQEAEDILGWSVLAVSQSEENKLANTLYTQPCLYVIECILMDLLKQQGWQPDLVAGHSLGEYVALYGADVFEFGTGLQLVKRRAELMSQASDGMMAALMGFDRDELIASLEQTADAVLANDNNPGQVVISGTPAAVESVMTKVKAKRAVPLKVSGAFHSPLMADAAAEFESALEPVAFAAATVPVLSNVEPTPSQDAEGLKQRLRQQMTEPVRWREISLQLPQLGIERVIEVGPGNVLTGLIKRTCKSLTLLNVGTLAQVQGLVK